MREEELIQRLESTELPDFKLESHRSQLKMALLTRGYSKKPKEATFLERIIGRGTGARDTTTGVLVMQRPPWSLAITGVLVALILLAAFFAIPQTSAFLKSTFFPEGSRTISGPQLTAEQQKKATDILMADPRIAALLGQGAVIDKILPIQVKAETVNSQTGNPEYIEETWAQAWLVKGDKDWGVQIDLVRGQIVSITP